MKNTASRKKTTRKEERLVNLPPWNILHYCIISHIDEFLEEIHLKHKAKLYDIILEALEEILDAYGKTLSKTPDPESFQLFKFLYRNLPDYWEEPSIELASLTFEQYNIDENAKPERFIKAAMLMALHIRNEMEDFHCRYLSDSQMRQLNPKIRQGLFEGLVIFIKGT